MQLNVVWKCARAAVVEITENSIYHTEKPWNIYLNDEFYGTTDTVETYIDGLEPLTTYSIRYERHRNENNDNIVAKSGNKNSNECNSKTNATETVSGILVTDDETFTLNVRDFGAAGDGERDDTISIQAAIMSCPPQGRVLVPAGDYRITNLFLKSDIALELAEGATLRSRHDRENLAYLPSNIEGKAGAGYAGTNLLPMGRWEGESMPMFCGILSGMAVNGVTVYGRGAIDGGANADEDNWWHDPKRIRIAARPRMIYLSDCERMDFAGITVRNSPSWNIHPVLSRDLGFWCLSIEGPKVSPNTDGLDPESCTNVTIKGCHFSVGDDCIAVKSGKIDMPRELRPACRNLLIDQCYMHDGHGSVVLGSEAAGGIRGLIARNCLFERTDRGLRIKTRRGRGRDSVYEAITFDHIRMDGVLTPFVVNSFYFCDKDGKTDYVQNREALPADERTPKVASLIFNDIQATNCHAAATYITGLPESKVGRAEFHNVHVSYADDAKPTKPAMACGVEPMARQGIIAQNVERLVLDDVTIDGQDGDELQLTNVDRVER
ncbi:glycoside hydrolase family 28 protein [Bifidobacterium callimiconis]|uniref:glycoside hydrolase family 28 protein n=1 Tax=Bifidobacterium callimiconis TaxID=2306973 RepID=UPI001BDC6E47|nr:glycoside hydrolase family 28 protein [Bifidobacterium callimiconis]MBT1176667.1 glycoside hydrolase family 28 protein [Bifidobacterium callimiconis]